MPNNPLIDEAFLEDVAIGERHLTSGRTVTEADVVNFAGLSGDFHSLHMDQEFASGTAHGRRIAHGMLIVSMTAGLVAKLPIMRAIERTTLGLVSVECRFRMPTFIGDTIRVAVEVIEKHDGRKPDRGTISMRRSVLNQREKVVIEGVWSLVIRRRNAL